MALISKKLLTRQEFREAVFSRDSGLCLECKQPAVDAHHIIERRLFPDGGYYLDNGASLCAKCHLAAEKTDISADRLRDLAGIRQVILPDHLPEDVHYDKWGNEIRPDGTRIPGELFTDKSVREMLTDYLSLFHNRYKYPRTYHLPWSNPGKSDRVLAQLPFVGRRVVVTEKLDGENTTLYRDYAHARSLTYARHESRSIIQALRARIAGEIPEGWRICGENVYAKHSIAYEQLKSYFYVFSIWTEENVCLSHEDTRSVCEMLGLEYVPVLVEPCVYTPALELHLQSLAQKLDIDRQEGYVVSVADSFTYRDFRKSVAKYVRPGHVQTDQTWLSDRVTPNKLNL